MLKKLVAPTLSCPLSCPQSTGNQLISERIKTQIKVASPCRWLIKSYLFSFGRAVAATIGAKIIVAAMAQKFLEVSQLNVSFYFHLISFELSLKSRIPHRLLRFLLDRIANDDVAGLRDHVAKVAHPKSALQVLLNRVDFRLQVPHRVQLPVVQNFVVPHQLELHVLLQHSFRAPAAQHRDFLLALGDLENLQYVRFTWRGEILSEIEIWKR